MLLRKVKWINFYRSRRDSNFGSEKWNRNGICDPVARRVIFILLGKETKILSGILVDFLKMESSLIFFKKKNRKPSLRLINSLTNREIFER